MASKFWVAGSGNWSDDTNHWALTSGGLPGGGNLPTSSDNVFFDTLSGVAGFTVTIDATSNCADLNFSAPLTGNVTWAGSSALNVFGSLTLYSGLVANYTGTLTFSATSTGKTITTAGVVPKFDPVFNGVGGGWTLQDNFLCALGNSNFTLTAGSFDTGNKTIQVNSVTISGSTTRVMTLGTSTINLAYNAAATLWDATTTTGLTFSGASSIIVFSRSSASTRTFKGGGLTYGTLTYTVAGSTGQMTMTGSSTFDTINFSDISNARSLVFTDGTTTTVRNFNVNGTPSKLMTINSTTTGTHTLVSTSQVQRCDYLSIQHSVATSGDWYAGNNSTNNQAVATAGSGWIFTVTSGVGGNAGLQSKHNLQNIISLQ